MNALSMSLLIVAMAAGPAALAKDKPAKHATESVGQLKQALATVAASATAQGIPPPEHFNPKTDKDQGDDHANPGAILKVCGKDTPAAHRSAMCPTGLSPD